jgi:hypothetical protein
MAEPTPSMEDVCEQAALRNMVMREATRQASESLQSALRTVVGSEQVPEEFVPKIASPAPDIEALLALIPPETPETPEAEATSAAVPVAPTAPTALIKPAVPVSPAAPVQDKPRPSDTGSKASATAQGPAPTSTPAPTAPQNTSNTAAPSIEAPATTTKIAFQPMTWPSFGSSPAPVAAKPQEKPAPPVPALGPNEVYFAPDEILFHKGDPADRFYVIRQGEVALFEPSTQKQIATLSTGTSFGEQAILVGGVRSVSARAMGGVVCLAISAQTLRDMLEVEQGSIKPVFESLLLQLYLHNDLHARGHKYNA